jgi:TaqI-like C-terminal specificity domain/Eco57I restriction-modification methylase
MAATSLAMILREPSLPGLCPVTNALEAMAVAGNVERGAVYTRREVVEFMLDLVGYTSDRPLHEERILEPSFGQGDFLVPALKRLLISWRAAGASPEALRTSIRGVELNRLSFEHTHSRVQTELRNAGIDPHIAATIADGWLVHGDFLLTPHQQNFTFIIGNPPYVRQELIADVLMEEYRRRYHTIYDRADIYIPFIERSLGLLSQTGQLCFICSDRWMKNRYGGPLRSMVARSFHVRAYVDMVDTPAFHSDVVAYPAITLIERTRSETTRVALRPEIESHSLRKLAKSLRDHDAKVLEVNVKTVRNVTTGTEPWLFETSDQLDLVRNFEIRFPLIEDVGCKVSIGVATGADKEFIGDYHLLDVETSRKLPIVMTRDIKDGHVEWRGLGVINPFGNDGRLVKLSDFPRLRLYLEARQDKISKRHVAEKNPANWYRTIDRIYPEIAVTPKLLIPDIKGEAHIVYEDGKLYPHHNLYFMTSSEWNIRALEAVLKSGIARLFVAAYSTQMRGGYLRFQAQYLRRIRLPFWRDVPTDIREALIFAAESGDLDACNVAAGKLYGLSFEQLSALTSKGG